MNHTTRLALLAVLLGLALEPTSIQAQAHVGTSMYFAGYLQDVCAVQYREGGNSKDPFKTLSDHGATIVRAALHLPPYNNSFTSGLPDVDWGSPARVRSTLSRATARGMAAFLTIAYDSYADVGSDKQNPYAAPPMWRDLATNETALADSIYSYTYREVESLLDAGVVPEFVAIGNEINWRFMEPNVPESSLGAFDSARKVRLLNSASRAIRDISAAHAVTIRVAMHIFGPSNLSWWMGEHPGLDFDVMGMSFYHAWHSMGSFQSWGAMAQWLKSAHDKDLIILETAQLWSNGFSDNHFNLLGAAENVPPGYPMPPTTETQRTYLRDITQSLVAGGGLGTIYWGGDWVGSDCYVYPDRWGRGSSWENKAFWDFNNNAHAGLDWFSDAYSTAVVEPTVDDAPLSIYPQPARDWVVVDHLPADATRLTLWSLEGRRVAVLDLSGRARASIATKTWPPGIYLMRIEHRSGEITHRSLVRTR